MKKPTKTFKKKKVTARHKPKGLPPSALRKTKQPKRERAKKPPPREVGLIDAVGEVIAVCEELAEEMRSWADNMPESKQGSAKADEVEAAADALENVESSDFGTPTPEQAFLNELKVTIVDPTPRRAPRSRATRLGDAVIILTLCINALEEFENEDVDKEATANEYLSELQDLESTLDGVEFPGMFG